MKITSINPFDQTVVGETECVSLGDLAKVVSDSRTAGIVWSKSKIEDRISYIKKYKELLENNKKELANLITNEMGKPIAQSIGEIDMELEYLEFYIDKSSVVLKEKIVRQDDDVIYKIVHEPLGVFACIAPWNFPLTMFHTGVIPALLGGNTVVFKPSELTTMSQMFTLNLLNSTGLPKNVLQSAVGGKDIGAALLDQEIDAVWFTGSTKVGKEIYIKSGTKFIKALLEMGGNSAAIVMDDADIDNAVENIFWGRYLANGQVCNADKRLFIQAGIYDDFMVKFTTRVGNAKLGDPKDVETEIGPVVSKSQFELLTNQLNTAISKGATVLVGKNKIENALLQKGNFITPTILTDVTTDMAIMQEEVFGPILPVIKFKTIEEVIGLANDSVYGLSGEAYTTSQKTADILSQAVKAGTIGINTSNYFKPECPFGGYKLSGLGREYGEEGFLEFVQTKTVVTTGIK
jgi:acyl-CoA reductase-like NAD-dependent aldehyde dehydrogenase